MVDARYRLPHCIYSVGKRQKGIYILKKLRGNFNGEGTSGPGYLDHQKNDAERLADIPKRDRQCIANIGKYQAADHSMWDGSTVPLGENLDIAEELLCRGLKARD